MELVIRMRKIILFIVLFAGLSAFTQKEHYRSDFANGRQGWGGWSNTSTVDISTVLDEKLNVHVLMLKVKDNGWNVPITKFTPVTVGDKTMIQFKIRSQRAWDENEITFFNDSEKSSYRIPFPTTENKWITVQKYIYKAVLKKGNPAVQCDGMLGDQLNGFQLATMGSKIELADVVIFEATGEEPELPLPEMDPAVAKYLETFTPVDYPVLRRNGVFPYGPVNMVRANVHSGKLFDRPVMESYRGDLIDMRRHYMNTFINFWESTDLAERLKMAEETGMYLIETVFCGTNFAKMKPGDKTDVRFRLAKESPALLAWYGRDEPSPAQLPEYLESKKALAELDNIHPLTSALHLPGVRRKIGPVLEVMMPDVYNFYPGTPTDGSVVIPHFKIIRECHEQTAGKRIWYMCQTFSNRHFRNDKTTYSARYPNPEEMRLELYTAVAAGANGILFFVYNDYVTYLDDKLRGEEFDWTMVDQWGNGNGVYDEIADFGRKVVPVMPSFINAEPGDFIKTDGKNLLIGQLRNECGTLVIAVNPTTLKAFEGPLNLQLPSGTRVYDLIAMTEVKDHTLKLRPAEGALWLAATPRQYEKVRQEIDTRRGQAAQGLADIRKAELAAAGFVDGKASPEWLSAEAKLVEIRQQFGRINRYLTQPEIIIKAEQAPEYKEVHAKLIEYSTRYFAARREHGKGQIPNDLDLLLQNTKTLKKTYRSL